MIKYNDIANEATQLRSAVKILNQIIFNPRKAYSTYGDAYHEYGHYILSQLKSTAVLVSSGRYTFKPYHVRTFVRNNKERILYLAEWQDKFVEKWLADMLNHALTPIFSNHSYAYRSGRFGLDRCQSLVTAQVRHHKFIIKRDITQFFYSIPQDAMCDVIASYVDPTDVLYSLLKQRVKDFASEKGIISVGLPFGSPLACVLANLYLTSLDRQMQKLPVKYYRYADDFLIMAKNESDSLNAANTLDSGILKLGLTCKPSHHKNTSFIKTDTHEYADRFEYLGLIMSKTGVVSLSTFKQRKIINCFKRTLKYNARKIRKASDKARLDLIISLAKDTLLTRIRSAAVIDYYLKHVTDESQLRLIDMLICQLALSYYFGRTFRYSMFSKVSYKTLRQKGLPSLVHRHRLFRHGNLKVSFLDLRNEILIRRHTEMIEARKRKIEGMRMTRKLTSQKGVTETVSSDESQHAKNS